MIDLSGLCDGFYTSGQGYLTGKRQVQIEQGLDSGPVWSI